MAAAGNIDPIVRRVGRPYVIEAVRLLEAGEGSVDAIDAALRGVGYHQGPFRLLDAVGLDIDLEIDRELRAAFKMSERFDPPALQVRLVDEGRLGQVSGRGFYRYEGETPAVPDVAVEVTAGLAPAQIVERLQLGVINEAYRMVEEGLASPTAIDAALQAAGHPRGPFQLVDELGMRAVIDGLRATHVLTAERSGDQYVVATALWQLATM